MILTYSNTSNIPSHRLLVSVGDTAEMYLARACREVVCEWADEHVGGKSYWREVNGHRQAWLLTAQEVRDAIADV